MVLLTVIKDLNLILINAFAILMISAKLATPDLLKIEVF